MFRLSLFVAFVVTTASSAFAQYNPNTQALEGIGRSLEQFNGDEQLRHQQRSAEELMRQDRVDSQQRNNNMAQYQAQVMAMNVAQLQQEVVRLTGVVQGQSVTGNRLVTENRRLQNDKSKNDAEVRRLSAENKRLQQEVTKLRTESRTSEAKYLELQKILLKLDKFIVDGNAKAIEWYMNSIAKDRDAKVDYRITATKVE